MIPAALRRRGPEYIEQYRKALKGGKTTIKRLQLLVLGRREWKDKPSFVVSLGMSLLKTVTQLKGIDMSDIGLLERITLEVPENKTGELQYFSIEHLSFLLW